MRGLVNPGGRAEDFAVIAGWAHSAVVTQRADYP